MRRWSPRHRPLVYKQIALGASAGSTKLTQSARWPCPDDAQQGSYWDHVLIDPETKLVVSLVVGRRDADTVVQLFTDFYERTDGYLPELI